MKLIQPSVTIVEQKDIFEHIENCARTCYKSEPKGDAKGFVNRLIKSHHTAMLEHGTVYLDIPLGSPMDDPDYLSKSSIILFFKSNEYSKVNEYVEWVVNIATINHFAITTNLRVIQEQFQNTTFADNVEINKFICQPTEHHEKRITARIITDRGVSHELVRHRKFSFAQESTRFCNYSKTRFGNELAFIEPSWWDQASPDSKNIFIDSIQTAEECYLELIKNNWTPQQARQVLPNAIKTEIVMTGFESDWDYFFRLRLNGETGAPHPDMKKIAGMLKKSLEKD